MSVVAIILLVLVTTAAFVAPLIWDVLRENRRLEILADEGEHFRLACENASDGLLVQDMQGRILWANAAFCRIHGRELGEIMGLNPQEFAYPPNKKPDADSIKNFRYDPSDPNIDKLQLFENQTKDGRLFWAQVSVSLKKFKDGREFAIVICRDATEQVNQERNLRDARQRLQIEATHDGLTGVANRAAFLAFMNDALLQASEKPVGLLHVDLDEFKVINDTHGHSAGDAVLTYVAQALRQTVREGDLVARVGGDEFVVVCPDIASLERLDALATNMMAALSEPFEWSNRQLRCEASIGAALATKSECVTEDLLVQSDFALYEAKREGRNRVALYDENLHARHAHYTQRAIELAAAIDTGDLDYFFQPMMNLKTGEITKLETLARWTHPIDGVIPPDDFLPIAREMGLMGTLDLWSMTAALQQKGKLNDAGFADIGITFNASPELLSHPEFVSRLVWGVEAGGLDRSQITIEVLETTRFGEASETSSHAAIISDLWAAGFQVHLDDFGKGFAGLTHLAQLDVTGVKIDRSLIKDILDDDICQKIVRKTVELSNDLGLCVVAEGVEDNKTSAALRAMGCETIQGFWLSKPLPEKDLLDWLNHRRKASNSRHA